MQQENTQNGTSHYERAADIMAVKAETTRQSWCGPGQQKEAARMNKDGQPDQHRSGNKIRQHSTMLYWVAENLP